MQIYFKEKSVGIALHLPKAKEGDLRESCVKPGCVPAAKSAVSPLSSKGLVISGLQAAELQ